jgi:hypothetical protein
MDRPAAETSTWQHTIHNIHNRYSNQLFQQASGTWIQPLLVLPAVPASQRHNCLCNTCNMSSPATYLQVNIDGRTSLSHYLNMDPLYPTADCWFNQTKTPIALCKQKGHCWHLLVHTKVCLIVTGELIAGPELLQIPLRYSANRSNRSPYRERDFSSRKPVWYCPLDEKGRLRI